MDTIAALIGSVDFTILCDFIGGASQTERKHIVSLARHRGLPIGYGNLYNITNSTITSLLSFYIKVENMSPTQLIFIDTSSFYTRIDNLFSDPLLAGAAMMCCFIAPIDTEEEQKIILEAYLKEINVMNTDPYFPNFDFSCFFGNYDKSLHPRIQPNPSSARTVHQSILTWVSRHTNPVYIHKPALSTKLLPKFTRQDMALYVDTLVQEPSVATQGALEYLYMKYDYIYTGACQINQRWAPNALSPRTYFVCGPDLYNRSKYTRDLWNDLSDSLVTTHRINRVNPARIHIQGIERALFYDLSSFTSNCSAQQEFLNQLSRFVDGLPFKVQDSRHGDLELDFGDVVREYAQCNIQPEYNTGDLQYHGTHGVAGFLGVYGNIATCTFLHGAFLLQLSTPRQCGCAGDDAVLVTVEDDDTVWACVSLIGIIAREKTFSSLDPDVLYLKRRTWVDEAFCRLAYSSYVQLPSFLFKLPPKDRSRFRESQYNEIELKELSLSSLNSFFKSVVVFKNHPSFPNIVHFCREYYELLRIPATGNVPQFTKAGRRWYKGMFIPMVDYLGEYGYITGTIESSYPGWCHLPDAPILSYPLPIRLQYDMTVKLVPSKNVSLLRKMGVLEPVKGGIRRVYGDEGLQDLLDLYKGAGPGNDAAAYKVIRDISDVPCPPEVIGEIDFDAPFREFFQGFEDDVEPGTSLVHVRYAEYRSFPHRL
jgi:hypothetical protein